MSTEYKNELARIKEVLREHPRGRTVTDISKAININRNSVAKYLDVLQVTGKVDMRMFGPAKAYFLSHRVPISTIWNLSSDYIIVMNSELELTQMSDDFSYFLGVDKVKMLGRKIQDLNLPMFLKDSVTDDLEEALGGKESITENWFEMRKVLFCFRSKMVPMVFDDGSRGITLVMEDITEQKKAESALRDCEERYRALLLSFKDLFFRTDLDGQINTVSPSVIEMTGYRPREIKGLPLSVLFRTNDEYYRLMKQLEEEGEIEDHEIEAVDKSGERFSASLSLSFVLDDAGNRENVVGVIRNISEGRPPSE